jgi:hypothetical protein
MVSYLRFFDLLDLNGAFCDQSSKGTQSRQNRDGHNPYRRCRCTFAAGLRRATGCLAGFSLFLSSLFTCHLL